MWLLSSVVCGYVFGSYFLLRNPQILHKRKKGFRKCLNIAHRGGAGEAYENTMEAFRRAVEIGQSDMLEIDCHLTADNEVVIAHDPHLKRITDGEGLISEIKFSELPVLKSVLPIDFKPGHTYSEPELPVEYKKFAKLEDLFQAFPEVDVNIDVKVNDANLVRAISELVKKYKRENKTAWGNSKHETITLCHETNPDIGLFFSFRRVIEVLLLYYSGLLPFFPLKETHFEVPMPLIMHKMTVKDIGQVNKIGFFSKIIIPFLNAVLMQRKLFDHLTARGILVYVWVLNTEEEYRQAFECGASGVMSDYPTKLRDFLKRNPQYL